MLEDVHALLQEIGEVRGAYLVSCFFMNKEWRIDFYSPKEHKIHTFFKQNGKLQEQKDEIFQKKQKALEELHLNKVKIHYLQALENISVSSQQYIIILQVMNHIPVWNITIITPEFKVHNIKVNAENGDVVSEEEESILSFKKGGPDFKTTNISS